MMPEKLQAARLKLVKDRPYLGAALWAVVPVERPGLGTLAVDEWWRLYFDPAAVAAWSVAELAGVLYHEICHLLRTHPERMAGYERLVANLAADAEINDDLREERVALPGTPVLPELLNLPPHRLAEEYYDMLLRQAEGASPQPPDGGARGQSGADGPGQGGSQQGDASPPRGAEGGGPESPAESPTPGSAGTEGEGRAAAGDAPRQASAGGAAASQPSAAPDSQPGGAGGTDPSAPSDESGAASGRAAAPSTPPSAPSARSGGAAGAEGPGAAPDSQTGGAAGTAGGGRPAEADVPVPGAGRCGSCATGQAEPWEEPPPGEPGVPPGISRAEAELIRRQVAQEIVRIAQAGQSRGTLPGHWRRWAEEKLSPKVDWRRELAAQVRSALASVREAADYTYRRPSRRQVPGVVMPGLHRPLPGVAVVVDTSGSMSDRQVAQALAEVAGVVMPGLHRPLPGVAVVVDTSGSMSDRQVAQALAEVAGVLKALGHREGVHVLAVDAAVQACRRVFRPEQVELAGGGGTDMGVGLEAALRLRPRPEVAVVVTDGWTPWPDRPPDRTRVVVVLVGSGKAPAWAKTIKVEV